MVAVDIPCTVCGTLFPAKRSSAMYCTERCKKRAQRNPNRPATGTERPATGTGSVRAGGFAPVAPIRPAEGRIAALTERELMNASRLDTVLGAVALALAAKLDEPGLDTGSSIAALAREHRSAMVAALDGVNVEATPLERMKAQRERRSA